jgi:hypothetical protein
MFILSISDIVTILMAMIIITYSVIKLLEAGEEHE